MSSSRLSTLTYPTRLPNVPRGPDPSDDFQATEADYVKFSRVHFKNKGGPQYFNVPGNKGKGGKDIIQTAYVAMPQSLAVSYGATYQQSNLGALGRAATGMLGSGDSKEVAETLKNAAGSALPESAFNNLAQGIQGAGGMLGLNTSGIDTNTLTNISMGKVLNPYSEQVFNGVGFRQHSFNFKMVARNEFEARTIQHIMEMFKIGMLPAYSSGDNAGGDSLAAMLSKTGGANQRWLTVPDKFLIQFVRVKETSPASKSIQPLDHFKIDYCVLTGMTVNYTPDGQYVAIKDSKLRNKFKNRSNRDKLSDSANNINGVDGASPNLVYVPAITMDLSFTETSIMTQEKAVVGY